MESWKVSYESIGQVLTPNIWHIYLMPHFSFHLYACIGIIIFYQAQVASKYRSLAKYSRPIFSNFSRFGPTIFQGRLTFKVDYSAFQRNSTFWHFPL